MDTESEQGQQTLLSPTEIEKLNTFLSAYNFDTYIADKPFDANQCKEGGTPLCYAAAHANAEDHLDFFRLSYC